MAKDCASGLLEACISRRLVISARPHAASSPKSTGERADVSQNTKQILAFRLPQNPNRLSRQQADGRIRSMEAALSGYPRRSTDKIRYADTDRQGHVNNALFATFLETGRVEILYDPEQPLAADGAEFVIARLSLDFRGELRWPGSVTVGTAVRKIGNSSVELSQIMCQQDRCVACAETVIVQVDRRDRTARPLTEQARAKLAALQLDERDPATSS